MKRFPKIRFDWVDLRKFGLGGLTGPNRRPLNKLLGLGIDGTKIEGVLVRRTNGGFELKNAFAAELSLDPLTDDPILVGRDLRKKLDSAQIRERRCVVCIPLAWVLTSTVKLPELPESDLVSLLELEAERAFPYSPETLMLSHSRYRAANGEQYALLVAVPREHINRLESVLTAAQLRPISFSLGVAALHLLDTRTADGTVGLLPCATGVNLQITCGGGIAALRTIDVPELPGAAEGRFEPNDLIREIRVTLGQLSPEIQAAVRHARVFGQNDDAEELAETVGPRLEQFGIETQQVRCFPPTVFGMPVPGDKPISAAGALALLHLANHGPSLEFLPPRLSAWQRLAQKYSSRKLARVGLAVGGVGVVVALGFLVQQIQLVYWQKRWDRMKTAVAELDLMQRQIKKFRPWYDDSFRSLNVLRRLTEAFPEDGTVSAKTVEIRQPAKVTCTGTARDNAALLRTLDKLRAAKEVDNVHLEQTRGGSPLQFTFNFQWIDRPSQ